METILIILYSFIWLVVSGYIIITLWKFEDRFFDIFKGTRNSFYLKYQDDFRSIYRYLAWVVGALLPSSLLFILF